MLPWKCFKVGYKLKIHKINNLKYQNPDCQYKKDFTKVMCLKERNMIDNRNQN